MLCQKGEFEDKVKFCERIVELADEEHDSNVVIDAVLGRSEVSLDAALDLEPSSINGRDDSGRTALHWAAREGNRDAVTTLLSHRADVTLQDNDGWTPLHVAAAADAVEVMQELINAGSDLEAVDTNGITPLLLAAKYAQCNAVNRLCASGADVFVKDSDGDTAFHVPAFVDPEGSGDEGVMFRFFDLLQYAGLQVDALNAQGQTPLMSAVIFNHVGMAQALSKLGADVKLIDAKEQSILHFAGIFANYDMIQALRNMEIETLDPDLQDAWGETAEDNFKYRMDTPEDELPLNQSKPTDEEIEVFFLLIEEVRERYEQHVEQTEAGSGATSPDLSEEQSEDSEADESEWETCSEGSDGHGELNDEDAGI